MVLRPYYAPHSLDISITANCNLRCSYCSHFSSGNDVDNELSLNEWHTFFEECASIGIMKICLSGGEPFCRDDIREIIQSIVDNRMRFSVLSNGALIDDDTAEFLKNTGRCNSVQISLDGSEDIHDKFRGKGSFRGAINGLKTLLNHSVPTTSRITLNKYNYHFLAETAELLLDDLKVPAVSTSSVCHFGLCRKNSDSLTMNAVEFSEAMSIIQELETKYPQRIYAMAGPQSCMSAWRKMEKAVSGDKEAALETKSGFLGSCGCVWKKLAVRADGIITPCGQLPQMELGHINLDKLRDVWLRNPVLESMRKRIDIKLSEFPSCADCRYREFCRGGCPATAYTIFGNENVPNLAIDSCYREFLNQGGKLPPEL